MGIAEGCPALKNEGDIECWIEVEVGREGNAVSIAVSREDGIWTLRFLPRPSNPFEYESFSERFAFARKCCPTLLFQISNSTPPEKAELLKTIKSFS